MCWNDSGSRWHSLLAQSIMSPLITGDVTLLGEQHGPNFTLCYITCNSREFGVNNCILPMFCCLCLVKMQSNLFVLSVLWEVTLALWKQRLCISAYIQLFSEYKNVALSQWHGHKSHLRYVVVPCLWWVTCRFLHVPSCSCIQSFKHIESCLLLNWIKQQKVIDIELQVMTCLKANQ